MILLATSNPDKYALFQDTLKAHHIEFFRLTRAVEEIQTLDLTQAAEHKAIGVYSIVKQPVVVDDAALLLDCYPQFPGTMTKDVLKLIGLRGLEKLLSGQSLKATLICHLSLCMDGQKCRHFSEAMSGVLNFAEPVEAGLALNSVFCPDGAGATLRELEISTPAFPTHRAKALLGLFRWLDKHPV